MKIKFFGTPNMLVKGRKRKPMSREFIQKPLFRFDRYGEYITEDEKLIEKLKRRFDYVPVTDDENNATGEEIKKRHCKKCEFSTDNMGELMAHYKKEHPKGVEQ